MSLDKVIILECDATIYSLGYIKNKLMYFLSDKKNEYSEAVYNAKIVRYNHHNRSAFVEYLPNIFGYVNLAQKLVQLGSVIQVQSKWLGDESKQTKLMTDIVLVGKYVILRQGCGVVYSKTSVSYKDILLTNLEEIAKRYKIIWRSNINSEAIASLAKLELDELLLSFSNLATNNYLGVSNYLKILRSFNLQQCGVIINSQEVLKQLKTKETLWQLDCIKFDQSLNVEELLKPALAMIENKDVILNSGVKLIVHKLSGINLIDIDSNTSHLDNSKLSKLVLSDLVWLIKLHNMLGIILIDFPKNLDIKIQEWINLEMNRLLEHDITNSKILGFTKAGLYEIIRYKF